ncbi:hypothetical protein HKCCE3408_08610 [Rhodobacterales bacterium HKCCE3408]|nr:hypothetical protein [Rhodobacterales bacterium HKCCE3408]
MIARRAVSCRAERRRVPLWPIVFLSLLTGGTGTGHADTWPTTFWALQCNPFRSDLACDLSDPRVSRAQRQLVTSSAALERIGFRAPPLIRLDPDEALSPFIGYVVEAGLEADEQPLVPGVQCATRDGGIVTGIGRCPVAGYADPERDEIFFEYFEIEGGTGMLGVPTHEMFHQVQDAYGLLDMFAGVADSDWIIEGTATAVAEALVPAAVSSTTGRAYLDLPIYRAQPEGDDRHVDYAVYPFWSWFARAYGGPLPGGLVALHEFFLEAPNYAARRTGLDVVDGALRQFDPDGLWSIYPRFIAEYGLEEGHYLERVPPVSVRGMAPGLEQNRIHDVSASVEPVAARAYQVFANELDLPAFGEAAAEVEIRLTGPYPDALHLVVDDARYDTDETGADGERNVFRQIIAHDHPLDTVAVGEYFVRVVNVARDPAAMQRPRDFRLRISVFREFVHIVGDVWGSGPSPSDIDSPIRMDMDPSGIHLFPLEPTEDHANAGYSDLCILNLHFRGDTRGDGISLALHSDGPILPGEYPIATPDLAGPQAPYDHPGQFVAGMELSADNVVSQGFQQTFVGIGGAVEIERVTPRWIVGRARINGRRQVDGRWTDAGWQELPGDLSHLEVEIEFSVRHERPAGADDVLDVRDCVEASPPRPGPIPVEPDPDPQPLPPGPEPTGQSASETDREGGLAADRPDPSTEQAGDAETPAPPDDPGSANGRVGVIEPYLRLVAVGDVPGQFDLSGDDLTVTGGCFPGAGLILSMARGAPDDADFAVFTFTTGTPLSAGDIGTFALPDARWSTASAGVLAGPGSLEVNEHDAGLISGRITADLRASDGRTASVSSEFSVTADCPQ